MPLETELSTEDQAALDQMRADDAVPQTVEPTAEAGADTAAEVAEQQQDKRPKMVPHEALHEERERRKDMEKQLAEERKARQTLDERTNLILQRMGQPAPQQQPAAPELPDLQTHPVENLLGQIAILAQNQHMLAQHFDQRNQGDVRANQMNNLQMQTVAVEREFRATTPDYDDAVAHLASARGKELEIAGFNPVERQQIIAQEAQSIALRAAQTNRNAAEMAYQMAAARGYKKAAPPPAADEADATITPAERVAQTQRGQQQDGRSLSNVRGAGPRPLTAQRLLEMSHADFDKMMATPEGRDLMGS